MDRLGDEELWRRTEKAIRDILDQMEADGELPPDVDREELLTDVLNEALGLGPLEAFLADDEISEIMVNHANQIYIEKQGQADALARRPSRSNQAVLGVIERIVAPLGRRIDESQPAGRRAPQGRQPRQRDHPAARAQGPVHHHPQVQEGRAARSRT